MSSREEQERASGPYPQGELESPFLEGELFGEETEADWGAHLTALEAESPFRHAFEQSPAMLFEPEEPEDYFVEEEEWTESEDPLLAEAEDYDDEALAEVDENIEEFDEDQSYDDDEELRYAEGEGVDSSDEDRFLDEEAAFPEELLAEVQEREGIDYLDEVTDLQEAPAFDETVFPELEEELATGDAALRARVVEVAKREWERWGQGSKKETQPEMKEVLRKYWRPLRNEEQVEKSIQKRRPWSSAFISWVMREAKAGDAFKYSSLHTAYVYAAKKAFEARDASRFWAYPVTQAKPEIGDLVIKDRCRRLPMHRNEKCRECFGTNYDNVGDRDDKGRLYRPAHGDIVVSIDHARNRIEIIGGNVNDSVGERRINLDPQGFLPDCSRDGCKYLAILKPPGGERLATATPSSAGSGDLLPTWLSDIVKRGRLTLQAASAMLTGQRDVNTLTNMIFYAHHPHLPVGYKIKPHEKQLAESWVRIRDDVVKPLLGDLAAGVVAGSSPRTPLVDAVKRGRNVLGTGAPLGGVPGQPDAYRKFRLTRYYVVDQTDYPTGSVRVPIYDESRQKIADVSPAFFAKVSLEGTGLLTDDRLINVTGKKVRVSHDEYADVLAHHNRVYAKRNAQRLKQRQKPIPASYSGVIVENGRVVRAKTFHVVPAMQRGEGYGKQRGGISMVPFRTLAADTGTMPRHVKKWKGKGGLVPVGTKVYIKEYDGLRLPRDDGEGEFTHDGWFVVNDTGGAIFGVHFDVFVGTKKRHDRLLRKQVKLPEFSEAWFAGIEQRIPPGCTYGLKA